MKAAFASTAMLVAFLLAGCATQAVRETSQAPTAEVLALGEQEQTARTARFASVPEWGFTGRIAVGKAGKGGSGRIEWTQQGAAYEIALSAPVTRQSWRLAGDPVRGIARLEGLDGGPREGADAEALLLGATGWEIPVGALAAWVRGLAAPGLTIETVEYASDGRLTMLQQAGWAIRYTAWHDAAGDRPPMPRKIEAERGDARVRLVLDDWALSAP